MQQPSPRGSGVGTLLLAFVAGALGGAAGTLLVTPRGPTTGSTDDSGLRQSVAALDETVRALGAQVETLGRALPRPNQQPSEPLQVPDGGDQSIHDLVAVSEVIRHLEDIANLLQGRLAGATSGFAGASPLPLLDMTAVGNRSSLTPLATEENGQREVWRRHAFWTCQQVLEAYGLPDQIEAGEGTMGWYYDTGERTVHFVFHEGMLINFWN